MTTTASISATSQLIDANGDFVGKLPVPESDTHIHSYRTVAVVGCQSGGKSTLLNHVFGTQFPVLDAPKLGRRRTTLGIWAAVSKCTETSSNSRYIVLDVEGTDSRERGEGAKTFENRTALFTLALSDLVLVNMWAHDLGRYSAANYDLFETVFAHAIALRKQKLFTSQVKILIVIRDHDGESSITDIKRVLMGDLLNIWNNLKVVDISLNDVFDIDVIALPHKNYAKLAFEQGIQQLSQHLNTQLFSSSSSSLQNNSSTNNSNNNNDSSNLLAPLGGFDALAKQVWTSVKDSTAGVNGIGLDLPKQAALAANYRCGEIIQSLISQSGFIGQELQGLRVDVETHWQTPIDGFSNRMRETAELGLLKYDEKTAGYIRAGFGEGAVKDEVLNAVEERRKEFGVHLVKTIAEVRERFISVCWDHCMNGFEDEFRPMLGGTRGFDRNANRLGKTYICKYKGYVDDSQIPQCLIEFLEEITVSRNNENVDLDQFDMGSQNQEQQNSLNTSEQEGEEVDVSDLDLDLDVDLNVDLDDDGHVDTNDVHNNIDNDEDNDLWCVERFKREIMRKIDERKRMAELMLPGGDAAFGPVVPKQDPWWKGILIRGLILLINYVQATQAQRVALKLQRQHEKEFPPNPTF